ncbi:MAG TPA: c-type cytochrome domain-containing protein [Planctomycetota bacterium]|nr:c-type cytochrome domain-containing protein [Planctomycetota bacterium]
MILRRRMIPLALLLAAARPAQEANPPDGPLPIERVTLDRPADFKVDVFPILKGNCLPCHNAKDAEADVVLETPETMLKGGADGPVLVPGKADQSPLLRVASFRAKPHMPPRKNKVGARPLTPRELGILKLWIDEGAKNSAAPLLEAPRWQPAPAHWNPIYAVALDAEARFLACGRGAKLHVYHLPTRRLIDRPVDPKLAALAPPGEPGVVHPDAVHALAFSPDGEILATGGYRSIKLWKRQAPERKLALPEWKEPRAAALDREGVRLAVADEEHVLRVYDVASGRKLAELRGHSGPVRALAFEADGKRLASVSEDKTARIWTPADPASPGKALETPAPATAVAFLADGKSVAVGGGDGLVRLYPLEGEKPPPALEIKAHAGPVVALAAAPGLLVSLGPDGRAIAWNTAGGQKVREFAHGAPAAGVAVSAEARRVATFGGPSAKLWNLEDGKVAAELRADGPARRRDREAQALLAFAAEEVRYREQAVKSAEEAHKKEEEEVKKAKDAVPPAEKEFNDKEAALAKARQDREAAEKALREIDAAIAAARAGAEEAARKLAAPPDETALRKAEAEKAAAAEALAAAEKALAEAKPKADPGAADERRKREAEKQAADQALAEAQRAVDDLKKKLASAAPEARPDLEKALADARARRNDLRTRAEAAARALSAAPAAAASPDPALVQAVEAARARLAAAAAEPEKVRAARDRERKELEAAKAKAEQALKEIEGKRKEAEAKLEAARKGEAAAAAASEQAKVQLESARGRVEKAREAADRAKKAIEEAAARLAREKEEHRRREEERKRRAEELSKAAVPIQAAALSADGAWAVVAAADGSVHAFGAASGAEAGVLDGASRPAVAAAVTPAGELVGIRSDGSVVARGLLGPWTLHRTIEPTAPSRPPIDRVLALAFSPDGTLLAGAGGVPSRDGEIALWNPADGSLVREIPAAHSDTVFDVAFSPDGTLLASVGADKFAKIFEVASGRLVRSFEGHTHHVLGVSWNRTGRTIATAGADETVKVWDVETGQQRRTLRGFTKQATSIEYLPFEDRFVVASGGAPVRLVQENGNAVRTFDSQGAFLYSVAVSAETRLLAAGGLDGVLRVWRVDDGQSVAVFSPPVANR